MYTAVIERSLPAAGQFSLIYRVVDEPERDAHVRRLFKQLGKVRYNADVETYALHVGYKHAIDTDHLVHVLRRHREVVNTDAGESPIEQEDLFLIPRIVVPANLVELGSKRDVARLIYEATSEQSSYRVVEEIHRRRHSAVLVTMYKIKQGRGGQLAGE